eukprot:328610-Rhodomonas_salina.1
MEFMLNERDERAMGPQLIQKEACEPGNTPLQQLVKDQRIKGYFYLHHMHKQDWLEENWVNTWANKQPIEDIRCAHPAPRPATHPLASSRPRPNDSPRTCPGNTLGRRSGSTSCGSDTFSPRSGFPVRPPLPSALPSAVVLCVDHVTASCSSHVTKPLLCSRSHSRRHGLHRLNGRRRPV